MGIQGGKKKNDYKRALLSKLSVKIEISPWLYYASDIRVMLRTGIKLTCYMHTNLLILSIMPFHDDDHDCTSQIT